MKVSKSYINAYGNEMVKCSVEGKFTDLECDITDGKVVIFDPWGAGFDDFCPECYTLADMLTIVHNNNQQRRRAKKKVKEAVEIDKNPWYTRNDKKTDELLARLKDTAVDILIEYIDKYPSNMLSSYYSSLLIRLQTNEPTWKALSITKSNKLPVYNKTKDKLVGSTQQLLLLLRTVYPSKRVKHKEF